jgi:hypothetical protein
MEKVTRDVCEVEYPPKVYGRTLDEVERTAQEVVEKVFRDKDGMIRSGVNGRTMRPLKEKDVTDRPNGLGTCVECAYMPRHLKPLWLNYEDAGMASGKYLCAMLNKHAVTQAPKTLAYARRTFEALVLLWNNCAAKNPFGRGWMPKPYAGIRDVSEVFECSVDQYSDITQGLYAFYREAATPPERQTIKEMVLSFADWWMERDYTTGYMGHCCYWKRLEYAHPIGYFLYLNALAHSFLPKRKYMDGFHLWLEISQGLSAPKRSVSINSHGLALGCLELLVELRPERKAFWLLCAQTCADMMFAASHQAPRTKATVQEKGYLAHHLCAAHALLPANGYDRVVLKLIGQYKRRADFYHLSRGLRLDRIDPYEAGGDVRNTFWSQGHICWLNAYWRLKRFGQ